MGKVVPARFRVNVFSAHVSKDMPEGSRDVSSLCSDNSSPVVIAIHRGAHRQHMPYFQQTQSWQEVSATLPVVVFDPHHVQRSRVSTSAGGVGALYGLYL